MRAKKHLDLGFAVLGIVFAMCSISHAELRPPDMTYLAEEAVLIGVIRVDGIAPKRDRSIEYNVVSATLQETIKGRSRSPQILLKTVPNMETNDTKSFVKDHRYLVFLLKPKSDYMAVSGSFGVFEVKNGQVANWPAKLVYPKSGNVGPEVLGPYRTVKYERARKDVLRLLASQRHRPDSGRALPAKDRVPHRTR